MPLPIEAIQQALADDGLDGWLLYDFHGTNPIAQRLVGLVGRHTTRRWFYFIPRSGTPQRLVHAIESATLDDQPGETHRYAGRRELADGLAAVLARGGRVAMEYSPDCAIPYVSRVDAGTVELVRSCGVEVASSGDLVGRFEAAWDAGAIATHQRASESLHRIKDQAFALVSDRVAAGIPVRELEIQARMLEWFDQEGLTTDAPPIVAVQEHSGDPHYAPNAATSSLVESGHLLLLDLWGKLQQPDAVYADITWTGTVGPPAPEVEQVFRVVAAARDAALEQVRGAVAGGRTVRGWEVDRAARDVIGTAGYGARFVHRTGHSLGTDVHGNGVHMDDYETHDDRRLLTGTGFTIEPGVYLDGFGIRSEINVVVGAADAPPTGPVQRQLVRLGPA
jgi:Xaa-Pro aminopeptidase